MTESQTQVALITGGASGIGLQVARDLVARGSWEVHIVDIHSTFDEVKVKGPQPPNSHYHAADVTDYTGLASAIKAAYMTRKRLDFVFANAGVVEMSNFFLPSESADEPPPPLNWRTLEINLQGCFNTVRIARHWMVQAGNGGSMVLTSSSAGAWPMYISPVYTAAKHGVVGLMRSVAPWFHDQDKIRVNALLPGPARTGLVPDAGWDSFPQDSLTSMDIISGVVLDFVDGKTMTDGKNTTPEKNYGNAALTVPGKFYFTDFAPYYDEMHEFVCEMTRVEKQAHVFK